MAGGAAVGLQVVVVVVAAAALAISHGKQGLRVAGVDEGFEVVVVVVLEALVVDEDAFGVVDVVVGALLVVVDLGAAVVVDAAAVVLVEAGLADELGALVVPPGVGFPALAPAAAPALVVELEAGFDVVVDPPGFPARDSASRPDLDEAGVGSSDAT